MAKITDEINRLKKIGIEHIYDKTLISYETIEIILNKDVSSLQSVKLNGFIRIIKREFNIDISGLIEEKDNLEIKRKEPQEILIPNEINHDSPKSSSFIFYFSIVLLVGIFIAYLNFSSPTSKTKIEQNSVKTKLEIQIKDEEIITPPLVDAKIEENEDESQLQKNFANRVVKQQIQDGFKPDTPISKIKRQIGEKPPVQELKSITLIPYGESQLWVGIIDLVNQKKYDKIITTPFDIPLKGQMLITTGHSQVKFRINSQESKYKNEGKLYFMFKNNQLTKISRSEFKVYNRGKMW